MDKVKRKYVRKSKIVEEPKKEIVEENKINIDSLIEKYPEINNIDNLEFKEKIIKILNGVF
jgi:hypothetical protein